jgi:hypothetical protein
MSASADPTTFLLGSEGEALTSTPDGVAYRPMGMTHAVDETLLRDNPDLCLAYAMCGQPVRVWRSERFDPEADDAHRSCCGASSGPTDGRSQSRLFHRHVRSATS